MKTIFRMKEAAEYLGFSSPRQLEPFIDEIGYFRRPGGKQRLVFKESCDEWRERKRQESVDNGADNATFLRAVEQVREQEKRKRTEAKKPKPQRKPVDMTGYEDWDMPEWND